MKHPIYYVNGLFLPEKRAKISVLDLGVLRGYGVFDFLRTYQGKPFKLEEHLLRLKNSAAQIGLDLPKPAGELSRIVVELLARNRLPEANIKIILTGGVSPDQVTPTGKPTLIILIYPVLSYPKTFYQEGVKVISYSIKRSFPTAKTINYIPAIVALKKARSKKAVEVLYLNEKKEILEGTTSNFFIFKNNTLMTPGKGILPGITRQVVLDLSRNEFKVKLRPIKYQELLTIDEAFLSASNKEIMPVVKIDQLKVGNGRVGEKTKRVMELFKKYTRE